MFSVLSIIGMLAGGIGARLNLFGRLPLLLRLPLTLLAALFGSIIPALGIALAVAPLVYRYAVKPVLRFVGKVAGKGLKALWEKVKDLGRSIVRRFAPDVWWAQKTPEERQAMRSSQKVEKMRAKRSRLLESVIGLSAGAGMLSVLRRKNMERRANNLFNDIQNELWQQGRLDEAVGRKAQAYSCIKVRKTPDGEMFIEIPKNLTPEMYAQINLALSDMYGAQVLSGEHIAYGDFKQVGFTEALLESKPLPGEEHYLLSFEHKSGKLRPFGEFFESDTVDQYVNRTSLELIQKLPEESRELGIVGKSGVMTLQKLGPDSVGVVRNGKVLACAVQGSDGSIRLNGVPTRGLDKDELRLVSKLNERLSDKESMVDWLDEAKDIVTSERNVKALSISSNNDIEKASRKRKMKEFLEQVPHTQKKRGLSMV